MLGWADFSHAIQQMTNLCLACLSIVTIGLTASFSLALAPETRQQYLLCASLLLIPLILRVWWGFHRAGWMRHWSMFFDCLTTVGIVMLDLLGVLLVFRGQIHLLSLIPMLGLSGVLLLHTKSRFWLTFMPANSLDPTGFGTTTWPAKLTSAAVTGSNN